MDKKQKIQQYFNKAPATDTQVSLSVLKEEEKGYSSHKLYESPVNEISNIEDVDPYIIQNWKYHDRPESELGDLISLSNDIKNIGQQQPCIVRPIVLDDSNIKYELIAGERRWRAAKLAEVNLKVIVKNLSDHEAAIIQIAENENRENLSDYAKAVSFQRLIDEGVLEQKDIIDKLGKSKQHVSALLSYSKIPINVFNAIKDFTKVSSSLAEKIKQLSFKGVEYQDAIIEISTKIREGKLGRTSLEAMILKKLNYEKTLNKKIYNKDGQYIFSYRVTKNRICSIHFSEHARKKLNYNLIVEGEENELIKTIRGIIED